MFNDPTDSSGSFIEPGRYVVKIVKLEPQPPSDLHPDWAPSVRMVLNLMTYPGMEIKRDNNGDNYEWWQYLSVNMGKGTKTRQKVEAFLGRELKEGQDTGAAIAAELIGKKAIAMIGPSDKGKDAILGALQPYVEPAQNGKAKATVAPPAEDVSEAQWEAHAATADAAEEAVPF